MLAAADREEAGVPISSKKKINELPSGPCWQTAKID
jgi:hypothetical protein